MRFPKRRIALILLGGTVLASAGCNSNQLETGYVFTPIGSPTSAQRKAFFANPFSPEARAAQMESATDSYNRGNRTPNN